MFKSFETPDAAVPGLGPATPFPFRTPANPPRRSSADRLLRLIDIVISLAALAFLAPVMLLAASYVRLRSPGPALFVQRRVGRHGRHFHCLKFRTMMVDAEWRLTELLISDPVARHEWSTTRKLRHDPRIVPGGHFLRRSSIDELPQLINVLRGDMSIVGPRPIVDAEIPRYGRHFVSYCSVSPGITGLWQISGRNDASYRRRVACDILYARRRSLGTMLGILLATVPAVFLARGAC